MISGQLLALVIFPFLGQHAFSFQFIPAPGAIALTYAIAGSSEQASDDACNTALNISGPRFAIPWALDKFDSRIISGRISHPTAVAVYLVIRKRVVTFCAVVNIYFSAFFQQSDISCYA